MADELRGALGIVVFIALAWTLSSHKRRFPFKIVCGGIALQFALALLVLKTDWGRAFFDGIGALVSMILVACDDGAGFVFGALAGKSEAHPYVQWFAVPGIKILTTIVVCSTLSAIGYHYGILQRVVAGMAWVMSRALGVSGAESLSCAANVFLGQTEAPLLVRPYIPTMTRSELMAVMTGGFATIAMGVMAIYVGMLGLDAEGNPSDARRIEVARQILTASLMSAPAAFVMAKIMMPEVDVPSTGRHVTAKVELETRNGLDAATLGASQGMTLAINVIAMLIAFIAMIKLLNLGLEWLSTPTDAIARASAPPPLTVQGILGWIFMPVAYFVGVEGKDLQNFGSLLGTAMATNEFLAYSSLSEMLKAKAISDRSATLAMYSLCGFANIGSMGIQIAGIGSMAPNRRPDLVTLAPRAMLGGAMASWCTGCIAGMLT